MIVPARAPPETVKTAADDVDRASPFRDAARAAAAYAPYLARTIGARPDLMDAMDGDWAARTCGDAIAAARAIAADPPTLDEGMTRLRRAKGALHLAVALADLSRRWPLDRVTAAITDFADASLSAAIALAGAALRARGDLEGAFAAGALPGMAFIAMGKMGAHELNYSSDIDFSVFYDPALLPCSERREPRAIALRAVQLIVKALEETTVDGYVFRTDLRLRPDPGSTPPAVTIAAAEVYYQSLGQNWERAAYIKARAAAGDIALGEAFLTNIAPYVWRRSLDYEAVKDVHSIKGQILSAHGGGDLDDPWFDVKLGRGGIRDIELHAQTQQLILGGRNRDLRVRGTSAALRALAGAGVLEAEAAETLTERYAFLRDVEHRIQMLEDAHTHRPPAEQDGRERLAALMGYASTSDLGAALKATRATVAEIDNRLFGRFASLADPMGSLIFTGVEDHPETLATIERLGFHDPAYVAGAIRGWHHGRIRAMRAERARELLTQLTPRLLRAFAATGAPDDAFRRFADFFGALNAGVQLLSLMDAQPRFLEALVGALARAPRLGETLAKRPALLDAMIDDRFNRPLSDEPDGGIALAAEAAVDAADAFEGALNAARRFRNEEAFRIGMQVLNARAGAGAAGGAYSDLAEGLTRGLARAARAEVERAFGTCAGAFCVAALGKFGGRELAEGSDLDVMIVYDAPEGARSDGMRSLSAGDFFARVTQRLISAMNAPTEEGVLYEIDMQLRPSGSKGPVAVRLSSFERYYAEEAWTWELLALTRLRLVAGDNALGARIAAATAAALRAPRDAPKIRFDVADMRARMERERPARSVWDLKLVPGGLVDVEFIAQAGQLLAAPGAPDVLHANTGEALSRLRAAGALAPADSDLLIEAWRFYSQLNQALRLCVEGEVDVAALPAPAATFLAGAVQSRDIAALEGRLLEAQSRVRGVFSRLYPPADGKSGPAR
ncbi:MAG: bifunctional [glutamine synthetase] adenylyltransferase/[glutamine synthetase]-adenylyl-L-tyrosine phosphorylase [Alphaproteobacteria bacterium]|nr:bifunctional [glutamine synthetase] adenylyltransferase/[glutamine synthetase]-adenylyl-L-tyrosine phosphorylase [Alphaproteobacteria bacterium]